MSKNIKLSVVVPIYNNGKSLQELTERINDELRLEGYELIYVNDCSFDDSMEIILRLSKKHNQIKYLDLNENIGQQRATLEGIKIATGERIVVMDGDLQDNPELIIPLDKLITSEHDVAYVKRQGLYQSGPRMLTSTVIKKMVQLVSGLHYKAGSYYLFDRHIQSKVIKIASMCRYPYMSIVVSQVGNKLKYEESKREKSLQKSNYNLLKRLRAASMAIYCALYCRYIKSTLD